MSETIKYPDNIRGTIRDNLKIQKLGYKCYVATSHIIDIGINEKIECHAIGVSEKQAESKVTGYIFSEMKKKKFQFVNKERYRQSKYRKRK